jgi:predicted RNA binding protein YcfA (HicA-like mRNA interferase family)
MKLPRDLGGRSLAATLISKWGYKQVHQSGSHIVLDTEEPNHQRIAVPDHRSLRIGTLNSILRIVAAHKSVTRQEILDSL